MKEAIRAYWTEIAFALSSIGVLTLPSAAKPLLIALTAIPTIEVLRRMWSPDVKALQQRMLGWHVDDLFGVYGSNEWTSTRDGSLFRPADDFPPAPGFNYRGLLSVAATCPNIEIVPVCSGESVELRGNTLLVGGTRVTPMLARFLEAQSQLPFRFVLEREVPEDLRPPTPPPTLIRHFNERGHLYSRKSVTGKYLVDTRDRGVPPFGPFVDKHARITGDVLVLTVGRDNSGRRVAVANAGYGAADRLPDVLCRGEHLERVCSLIPKVGPIRIQAVFTLSVDHRSDGEVYGEPELADVTTF